MGAFPFTILNLLKNIAIYVHIYMCFSFQKYRYTAGDDLSTTQEAL